MSSKWKFQTIRQAHAAIRELEAKLGLPESDLSANMTKANGYFIALNATAEKNLGGAQPGSHTPTPVARESAPPVQSTPPGVRRIPVHAGPVMPAMSAARPSLGQLNQIATAVFGREFPQDIDRGNYSAVSAAVEKLCFQAHLQIPGMEEAKLAASVARLPADSIKGALLQEQQQRQASINDILGGTAGLSQYLKLDTEHRAEFCQGGGRLKLSEFNALTPRAKRDFCVNGGKIDDDRAAAKPSAQSQPTRSGNSVSRSVFAGMSPSAQAAHCRAGLKIHAD